MAPDLFKVLFYVGVCMLTVSIEYLILDWGFLTRSFVTVFVTDANSFVIMT